MTVRRRVDGGGVGESIKIAVKDKQLNWHMFLRFLEDTDLKNSTDIGNVWGQKLAGALNKFFFKQRQEDSSRSKFSVERYVFRGMDDKVEKLSEKVIQMDVVAVAQVLFGESIKDGTAFRNADLMELLFPGVANPELLFDDIM